MRIRFTCVFTVARLTTSVAATRGGCSDWTIEVEAPFDGERRCASASLEPSERVVKLIAVSPSRRLAVSP